MRKPVKDGVSYAAALLPYGPALADEPARRLVAAAEEEAARRRCHVVVAVVEPSGSLLRFARMADANYGSIELAIGKAETAAKFRVDTLFFRTLFERNPAAGPIAGVVAMAGGLPIVQEGRIVGALGISGASAEDDGRIAAAALAAL